MAQRREGATSSASTSTTDRLSPSGVSQLRLLSRPMTTARSPLVRDSLTCSASCRHTLTRKNEVSPSFQVSPSLIRAVTARRKLATKLPLGVCLSSGSSVRLPVRVTWVSAIAVPSSGLVLVGGWLRWWSGRGRHHLPSWVSVEGGGEQGTGDDQAQEQGGQQAAASPHAWHLLRSGVVAPERVQVHGLSHGVAQLQDGGLPADRWGLGGWVAGSPVDPEGAGE